MNVAVSRQTLIILSVLAMLVFGVFIFLSLHETVPPSQQTESVVKPVPTIPAHTIIGRSVEGRNIDAYIFGNGQYPLLFVGGIHGGYEWNSVLLAYQFIDYLEENPGDIPQNITIAVIPSANPDGLYRVIQKEGRFTIEDIPTTKQVNGTGRFNAHNVDLNRNFDCKWKPQSTWKGKMVSAGSGAFSEPEAIAIRDFVLEFKPDSVVFWHSKSNAVYASQCEFGILPRTLEIMNAYSQASGYTAIKSFDSYEISGDAEGWLASIGIPAITVELSTHETVEWAQNLAGITALFRYFTL